MPLFTYQAKQAMDEVLRKYAVHLPAGLAARVRALAVGQIFRILPAAQYRPQFDIYFRSFFAAINSKAFGAAYTIGVANDPADVCGTFNCPAFCAPAINNTDRVIYVNRDEDLTVGTLYHEFIHYLSHPNFYPEFYALGGQNPAILEGVTEYLTRNVSPKVEVDRRSQNKYQDWLDDVQGALRAGRHGELDLIHFALHGVYIDLPGLGGVKPRHL